VECSVSRLEKGFHILKNSRLFDPNFASNVVQVLCAMHNYIEATGDVIPAAELDVEGSSFVPSLQLRYIGTQGSHLQVATSPGTGSQLV